MAAQRKQNRSGRSMYTDRAARQGYGADRSNLAYDYNALERRRVQERPTPHPQVRTIRRPKVNLRPAEQVSVSILWCRCRKN